jgi:glycine cleavage system aminomethyltransferase T
MKLDDVLQQSGATMGALDGTPVPLGFSSLEAEVRALRQSAGLSALAHLTCLRVSGAGARAALDPLCPVDLSLQRGAMSHSLLLLSDGRPFVDLYLCKDDDAFLLIAEGAAKGALPAFLRAHFPTGVVIEDLGQEQVMLSLNGPFAWEVMVELAGPEILGFPPLSFYRPTERRTYFCAGKTGEFGYDLLVPRAEVDRYWTRILEAGAPFDVIPVGVDALAHASLESWVFNIHCEGRADVTPLELALESRLSWTKDFFGKAALLQRKAAGITHRITALQSSAPFGAGDAVRGEGRVVGTVLHAARSRTIGEQIGIGLLEQSCAERGIDQFTVEHAGAPRPVRAVSAPFVNPRSFVIDPQQHSYHDRAAMAFPDPRRNP